MSEHLRVTPAELGAAGSGIAGVGGNVGDVVDGFARARVAESGFAMTAAVNDFSGAWQQAVAKFAESCTNFGGNLHKAGGAYTFSDSGTASAASGS